MPLEQPVRVLGPSQRAKQPLAVAAVAVRTSDGKMLWGRRHDDGRETTPAGHLEPGEDPRDAAARETWEEAGIEARPEDFQDLGSRQSGQYLVHCFALDLPAEVEATSENDPDEEVGEWRWVDASGGLPPEVVDNLHVPVERNSLLSALDMGGVAKAEPSNPTLPLGEYWSGEASARFEVHRSGAGYQIAWSDGLGELGATSCLSKAEASHTIRQWLAPKPTATEALAKSGGAPEPKPKKPRAPRKSKAPPTAPAPPDKSLVVQHNISEGGLENAHKIGGLPAPSLAVAHKDHPLAGFGEITMVAHPSMADPKQGVPLYNADIYSPRYPRPKKKINESAYSKFRQEIGPHLKDVTGSYPSFDSYDFERELERGTPADMTQRHWAPRAALGLAYLRSKGERPEPEMEDVPLSHDWSRKVRLPDLGQSADVNDPTVLRRIAEESNRAIEEHGREQGWRQRTIDDQKDKAGLGDLENGVYTPNSPDKPMYHWKAEDVLKDVENIGKKRPNYHGFEYAIHDRVKNDPEFHEWAAQKLAPLQGDEYVETSGGRKLPHTLENVLRVITSGATRGGENWNMGGVGSARALGAKPLRSLEEAKASGHKLTSKKGMEEAKEAFDHKFGDAASELYGQHPYAQKTRSGAIDTFGALDSLNGVFKDYFKTKNIERALREQGYTNVSPQTKQRVQALAHELVDMPTEYFEAKPQRAVGLNEFRGAAIPHNASQRTRDILRHHGVKWEEYKSGDEEDRKRAIQKLAHEQDLMLSEAELGEGLAKAGLLPEPHGQLTTEQVLAIERDADSRGKQAGNDRTAAHQIVADAGPHVLLHVPLNLVNADIDNDEPGEAQARRIAQYASLSTNPPPIRILYGPRSAARGVRTAFVANGNHRVAAARIQGKQTIEAMMPADAYARWNASLNKAEEMPRDVVVCIPKSRQKQVEQEEREVAEQVKAGQKAPSYYWTVHRLPKALPKRIYFAWDGAVRAYHECVGSVDKPDPRLLMDHVIHQVDPIPMKAFRGWRYWDSRMAKSESQPMPHPSLIEKRLGNEAVVADATPAENGHADEIARLMRHPDPLERAMALKLSGVRRHHLAEALLSGDPALEHAALAHPALDDQIIGAVAASEGAWGLKRKLLARADLGAERIGDMARSALRAPESAPSSTA